MVVYLARLIGDGKSLDWLKSYGLRFVSALATFVFIDGRAYTMISLSSFST